MNVVKVALRDCQNDVDWQREMNREFESINSQCELVDIGEALAKCKVGAAVILSSFCFNVLKELISLIPAIYLRIDFLMIGI